MGNIAEARSLSGLLYIGDLGPDRENSLHRFSSRPGLITLCTSLFYPLGSRGRSPWSPRRRKFRWSSSREYVRRRLA